MSRYIDADAVYEELRGYGYAMLDFAAWRINEQPTADVVEVKRGENICDSVIGHCEFKCSVCLADISSVCGGSLDGGYFNYCPNCGAKMKEETV